MTLTRPAYEITVENLDNPWTMTVTQGVAGVRRPAAGAARA
jgi:hypothetical protein